MRELCVPGTFRIGEPCIYAGPTYQVMRNIAFAAELGRRKGKEWRVLFAFPASGHHDSAATVDAVVSTLVADTRRRVATVDYDRVTSGFRGAGSEPIRVLGEFMAQRLEYVT